MCAVIWQSISDLTCSSIHGIQSGYIRCVPGGHAVAGGSCLQRRRAIWQLGRPGRDSRHCCVRHRALGYPGAQDSADGRLPSGILDDIRWHGCCGSHLFLWSKERWLCRQEGQLKGNLSRLLLEDSGLLFSQYTIYHLPKCKATTVRHVEASTVCASPSMKNVMVFDPSRCRTRNYRDEFNVTVIIDLLL